jgi:hypothetical protein
MSPTYQHAVIKYDGTTIDATFGEVRLTAPFSAPPGNYLKVTAATGLSASVHKIRRPVFIPLSSPTAGLARSAAVNPAQVQILKPDPIPTPGA